MKNLPRYITAIISLTIPCLLLMKGIYGSFLFCFSIPLIWQVTYLGEPISSLGLKKYGLGLSIIWGIVSGIGLGLLGGILLKYFNFTGNSFMSNDTLGFAVGTFKIEFSLAKELGYQLLTKSTTAEGLIVYLLFSILLIGLGEELFWRGFIQKKIINRVGRFKGVIIASALFALIHFYILTIISFGKGLTFLLLIGLVGVIWGYLYERTGNIWSAAISHGITAAVIWKYYFFVP
jgi:membrane protease YdiL (CAAX protease family)